MGYLQVCFILSFHLYQREHTPRRRVKTCKQLPDILNRRIAADPEGDAGVAAAGAREDRHLQHTSSTARVTVVCTRQALAATERSWRHLSTGHQYVEGWPCALPAQTCEVLLQDASPR